MVGVMWLLDDGSRSMKANLPLGGNKVTGSGAISDTDADTTLATVKYVKDKVPGGSGAPANAQYLVLAAHVNLDNERVIALSSDFQATDGGSGGNYTINLTDTGVVAGEYTYATVTVDAKGRVTSIGSGVTAAPAGAKYLVLAANSILSDERVLTLASNLTATDSGTNGGAYTLDLSNTGVSAGLYDWASVTVDAKGRVTAITQNAAPASASESFLVVAASAALGNERVMTAGNGISFTDGGSGGNFTIAVDDSYLDGRYVNVGGDTMTGDLQFNDRVIKFAVGVSPNNHTLSMYLDANGNHMISGSTDVKHQFSGPILPIFDGGYALGASNKRFSFLYLSDTIVTSSTAVNTNFNADMVDGYHVGDLAIRSLTNEFTAQQTFTGSLPIYVRPPNGIEAGILFRYHDSAGTLIHSNEIWLENDGYMRVGSIRTNHIEIQGTQILYFANDANTGFATIEVDGNDLLISAAPSGIVRTNNDVNIAGHLNVVAGDLKVTSGQVTSRNGLTVDSNSSEGGQLNLKYAGVTGIGEVSAWVFDVTNTNQFRWFYHNGTSGSQAVMTFVQETTLGGALVSNVALFGNGSFGGGKEVIFIKSAATLPTTNPVGGGILYVDAGQLKYRGENGTVTTLGPS